MKQYRHRQIVALLESRPAVRVTELALILNVAVGTIRRDLAELQKGGFLRRVHGGAFAAANGESNFTGRACWNLEKKKAMGKAAAELIHSGQVIFIDGGTTSEALLPHLSQKTGLTVVTCGINIAVQLLRWPYIRTILLGGEVHTESRTVIGTLPVAQLDSFGMRFDVGIITTAGISAEHGATNRMLERLPLKQKVIASSALSILLADSSKLGSVHLGRVALLREFDHCFMDDEITEREKDTLRAAGNFTFVTPGRAAL